MYFNDVKKIDFYVNQKGYNSLLQVIKCNNDLSLLEVILTKINKKKIERKIDGKSHNYCLKDLSILTQY